MKRLIDLEMVIKWLEETETALKQAVDCGGEMSLMRAFKSECRVRDAIAMLKAQAVVRCKECGHKGNPHECRLDRDLEEHGSHRTDEWDDWYCADAKPRESEQDAKDNNVLNKIVRCGECKYFHEGIDINSKHFTACNCGKRTPTMTWGASVTPDWFCGHAEAKGGEVNG